jgi:hypothetical protein
MHTSMFIRIDSGRVNLSRAVFFIVILVSGLLALQARAQSIPAVELSVMHSGAATAAMISVTPTDQGELYVVADATGVLNRDAQLMVTRSGRFASLMRLSVNNTLIWSREFDSSKITIWDSAKMPDGGVVLVGAYSGSPGFPTNSTLTVTNASTGGDDLFICRYYPDGTMAWLRTGGGTGKEIAAEVAVDSAGNIGVVGAMGGNATLGGQTVTGQGQFLAKYDGNGNLLWLRSVTGDFSEGRSIAIDDTGNYYTGGNFKGDISVGGIMLKADGSVSTYKVNDDAFVVKYSSTGTALWARRMGGDGGDNIGKVRTYLSSGIVCVGGFFNAANFGGNNLTGSGLDGYVTRLDANGSWVWARALGGSAANIPIGLGADNNGDIFVGGYFDGTLTLGTTNLTSGGSYDGFIAKLSSAGATYWAVQVGTVNRQNINDILVTGDNKGYYWGDFAVSIVDSTSTHTGASINNGFYGRFEIPTPLQLIVTPAKTTGVQGESITLVVAANGTFPTYQWVKDGVNIIGANSPTFTIPVLAQSDEGNYSVVISNPLGSITTTPIFLGVYVRPQFTMPPVSVGVNQGGSVTIQVTGTGKPTPSIRWRKDDDTIIEQEGDTFQLNNISFGHDGAYSVDLINAAGTTTEHFRISVDMILGEGVGGYVHEGYRDVVYVSGGSEVKRFALGTKSFQSPYVLGGDLGELDVSPDGRWLVVADRSDQGVNNRIYVVNLATGTASEVLLAKEAGEGALSGVAFGADGRVVLTSAGQLRSYDPATGNVSRQAHAGASLVSASADRQTLALLDLSNANGSLHRYEVAGGSISASSGAGMGEDAGAARTGGQFARVNAGQATFYDGSLQTVLGSLGSGPGAGPGGVAYHPQQDLVYVSWEGSTEVRAYSTTTFAEQARYYVDSQPLSGGRVRLSRTGDLLLAETPYGIRYVVLPAQPPLVLASPQDTAINAGNTVVLGVTAYGPAGTLQYQWQKEGEDIPDATGRQLTLVAVDSSAVGAYRVRVSNGHGFVYSEEAQLTVLQGDPLVTWNNPADIAFGTLLGAVQLNATAVTAGTFTYEPPAGTRMPVGQGLPLRVVFTPTDTSVFTAVTNTVFLNVLKKPLTITTANTSREYGLANPDFPLNVFGLVSGDTLGSLDVVPGVTTTATVGSPTGTYPITISGGLDDNYSFIYGPATLTVTKRTVTIVLKDLSQAYNGTPRPVSATTSPEGVPLNLTYNGVGTAPTALGTYPVAAVVGNANYQGSANGSLTIYKGSVPITWEVPAPVIVGTALGAGQLNAVAAVPGIYTYTPAAGAVLPAGVQALRLVFTPLDTGNYLRTTNNQPLVVLPLALANPQLAEGNQNEFRFEFTGVNGVEYNVEVSGDLVNWSVLYSFTAAAGAVPISDPAIATNPRRFYRISPKP